MSKIDETKERINYMKTFLTILFGVIVLTVGGLANFYLKNQINEVFWVGVVFVIILMLICFALMVKIENLLKHLGRLYNGFYSIVRSCYYVLCLSGLWCLESRLRQLGFDSARPLFGSAQEPPSTWSK